MTETIRQAIDQNFSSEHHFSLLNQINTDLPNQLAFRVAATPIFISKQFANKLLQACNDIVNLISRDDFKALTDGAIPAENRVPNEDKHTQFLIIDFAVCRNSSQSPSNNDLIPQLIELQGFPSHCCFVPYLADLYRAHFAIPENLSHLFNVETNAEYLNRLRQMILGDFLPEEVILLEIYPEKQGTRIDFILTERYIGVSTLCLTKVRRAGRILFYEKDDRTIRIKRIYNRIIADDLKNFPAIKTEFNLTDDVDVQWVSHPNWFYRISKYILPLLRNIPYVPDSYYLSDINNYPVDLENYVLKPLFSFGGNGVKLNITRADIDAIPGNELDRYILQRKVKYEPIIDTPTGLMKCEIRMIFIQPQGDHRPTLLTNFARLTPGEMINASFNRDCDWAGDSICFFEK